MAWTYSLWWSLCSVTPLRIGYKSSKLPINENPTPNDRELGGCAWNLDKHWEDEEVAAANVTMDSLAAVDGELMRLERKIVSGRATGIV